jgi:putative endonuclease
MPNLRRVGADAEDRAAEHLIEKGYTIVTRRWTTRGGELDLVALDGDVLVFIEVKARSGRWTTPEEAVTSVKIQRFLTAVQSYCNQTDQIQRPVRYDVVAIDDKGIRHYEDAFRA